MRSIKNNVLFSNLSYSKLTGLQVTGLTSGENILNYIHYMQEAY